MFEASPQVREFPTQIAARFETDDSARWSFCPPGWLDLLIAMDHELNEVAPHYTIRDIKEKFGGLRVSVRIPRHGDDTGRSKAKEIIRQYQNESFRICDRCGEPGETNKIENWLLTRCQEHNQQRYY